MEFTSYKNLRPRCNPLVAINAMPVLSVYPVVLPVFGNEGVEGHFREITQLCVATGKLTVPMAIALGLIIVPAITDYLVE